MGKVCKLAVGAIMALAGATGVVFGEEPPEYSGEFGFLFGVGTADENLVGSSNDTDLELILGVRGGKSINRRLNWFVDYTFGNFETDLSSYSVDVSNGRTGLESIFRPEKRWQCFLQYAVGWMRADNTDHSLEFSRGFASLGLGQRRVTERGYFRWEIRGDQTVTDDGLNGDGVLNFQALLGYSWGIGRSGDEDGDGVLDRRDRCPGTPHGCTVDEQGCPKDQDGDGVCDGLDACPDTPAGCPVDDRGCPLDTDGDGTIDCQDKCAGTVKGCPVDASGCPKDEDGDGVCDGLDRCSGTAKGCQVDTSGCPKDEDGDGVCDGLDRCPGTAKGCQVDTSGCPKDEDGDRVCDGLDRCPGTPKGRQVDDKGCEVLFGETKGDLVLHGVNFEFGSAKLTADSATTLDSVAASLLAWSDVRVEVEGHTDAVGADAFNLKLSQSRAEAVRDYLVAKGVDASRLVAKGYGEKQPVADNNTDEGRAKNRRVELHKLN